MFIRDSFSKKCKISCKWKYFQQLLRKKLEILHIKRYFFQPQLLNYNKNEFGRYFYSKNYSRFLFLQDIMPTKYDHTRKNSLKVNLRGLDEIIGK